MQVQVLTFARQAYCSHFLKSLSVFQLTNERFSYITTAVCVIMENAIRFIGNCRAHSSQLAQTCKMNTDVTTVLLNTRLIFTRIKTDIRIIPIFQQYRV